MRDYSVPKYDPFDYFLKFNESYESIEDNKTLVTMEDKLRDAYKAIFCTEYGGNIQHKSVGRVAFTARTKVDLLRLVGLLSNYSDYNIE